MTSSNQEPGSWQAQTSERINRTLRLNRLPGNDYDPEVTIDMGESQVLLLWSRWGVEGVYTDPEIMARQYTTLKTLRAYAEEPFSYEVRYLDQVN